MAKKLSKDRAAELALAIKHLQSLQRLESFDPYNPTSRATSKQQSLFDDFGKYKQYWVRAGNQCKPSYSLVLMADGTQKPIGDIQEGDLVMAFDMATATGVPSRVVKKWNNGMREVFRYHYGADLYTDSTPNHRMLHHSGKSGFGKREIGKAQELVITPVAEDRSVDWKMSEIRSVEFLGEMEVYDITIDHPDHTYICDGLGTSNSGKSQTCARLLTWVLTDTHPSWKRPSQWLDEPILAIVAGRTGKQIEESLLPKIRSYLSPGSYKEIRIGNIIQRLELDNGARIVFQSLENPTSAQQRLQSYVAHIAWVDELPPTMDIVREILVRTQARNGFNLFSFTPTIVNAEIQQFVDGLQEPEGKVYRFHMLDNPLYSDPTRREELLSRYAHLPEHQRDAILAGEWMQAADQVYYFNWNSMVEMPAGYSPMWRHVESVDPALKSALGLTVWAEDPGSGIWYCIRSDYVKGIYVPTELVKYVSDITKQYNIVRRIADPHEVWYIQTASSMGISYMGVYKKNERKSELIKGLQEKLGGQIRISPNCEGLISELQECRFSDRTAGKIVNSSSYHLLDSAQYFCDNIPKRQETGPQVTNWDEWLFRENEKRIRSQEQTKQLQARKASPGRGRGRMQVAKNKIQRRLTW